MPLLQGMDIAHMSSQHMIDTLGCCLTRNDGGDVRDLGLDGCLTDVGIVMNACLTDGRVDDQIDLTVGDQVKDVRASLVELLYLLCRDSRFVDGVTGLACGQDAEAVVVKDLGYCGSFSALLAVHGDKHSALQRESSLCGFLSLKVSTTGGKGHAQNLTGGTHLRPEDRVYLREHIEGEYRFLYAVIRDLPLLHGGDR